MQALQGLSQPFTFMDSATTIRGQGRATMDCSKHTSIGDGDTINFVYMADSSVSVLSSMSENYVQLFTFFSQ